MPPKRSRKLVKKYNRQLNQNQQEQELGTAIEMELARQLFLMQLGPLFLHSALRVSAAVPTELEHLVIDSNKLKPVKLAHIGTGRTSEVILQPLLNKDNEVTLVAVKIPQIEFVSWIIREAEIMSKLDHENVVKLLGIVKFGPHPHTFGQKLLLEYVPGGDLLAAQKIFEKKIILKLLGEVANGMAYINSRGILHRDLGCDNVFVNLLPQAKIGDFGLSRVAKEDGKYFEEGNLCLTGYNISPEANRLKVFSDKSEIWAMGILCWQIFYVDESNYSRMMARLQDHEFSWNTEQIPKSKACPKILYDEVIIRCLDVHPSERPNFEFVGKKIQELIEKNGV